MVRIVVEQDDVRQDDAGVVQKDVILYASECKWELDYAKQQLFSHLLDPKNNYASFSFELLEMPTSELLSYRKKHNRVILVFTSNLATFDLIRDLIVFHQPLVVVHMSDEWGTKPEFVDLSRLVPLVLRQHWFPHAYAPKPNIKQILLGYMTGFPLDVPHICAPNRRYVWSFIGTVNQPRREMIQAILRHWPNAEYFFRGGGVKVQDMAKTYGDAIFVPNGRGANRLDCFRIYEAMMVGAIPIVVGSQNEMDETFVFEGKYDVWPWVSATSWDEALIKCDDLLNNNVLLCETQHNVKEWIKDHFELVRERITKTLVLHSI